MTLPLMPPIILGDKCIEGVNENHFPNPSTFLTLFPRGLIKVGGVFIGPCKNGLGCPHGGIVSKLPLESTCANGCCLR
jgi:hypothetical protein